MREAPSHPPTIYSDYDETHLYFRSHTLYIHNTVLMWSNLKQIQALITYDRDNNEHSYRDGVWII